MTDGIFFFQDGEIVSGKRMPNDRPSHLIPRHVLITGVGRGGTTAVAMAVEALGFEAEEPTPYRESLRMRSFILKNDAEGALEHLATWPAEGRRMFWKDPKIWATKFDPFLERLQADIGLIFVVRDALTIASRNVALTSGDLLDELVNSASGQLKMARRLSQVRQRNVALLSYEKLLINPTRILGRLARFLGTEDRATAAVRQIEPSPASYQTNFLRAKRKIARP